MFMKMRHWLIQKLAGKKMIILNAEIDAKNGIKARFEQKGCLMAYSVLSNMNRGIALK